MTTNGASVSQRCWHLKQCALFESLPDPEIEDLAGFANVFSYGSKRLVDIDLAGTEYVWLVKRGNLKMNYTDQSGRQVAVVLLGRGDLFGNLHAVKREEFGEFITALTPSCLCRIPRAKLERVMMKHPEVCLRLAHSQFEWMHRLQVRLAHVMMRPAESRLAHILLELAAIASRETEEGLLIDLPVTHKDLAELIGTTREMVSYLMRRLREEGVVTASRQQIVIRDRKRLHDLQDTMPGTHNQP